MIPRPVISKAKGRQPKCFELSNLKCRVHPNVVLVMLDAYGRRSDDKKFVIGALLGTISAEHAVVEVSDCFVVEYKWNENEDKKDLEIIQSHYEGMVALKQRVNPQLQIVGCGCTMPTVGSLTAALNEWVHKERAISKFHPVPNLLPEPIHLLVDATLRNSTMSVKAFFRGPLQVVFRELPVEICTSAGEKAATSGVLRARGEVEETAEEEEDQMSTSSLMKLLTLTTKAEEYVRGVLEGAVEPDAEVGRIIMKALGSEPALRGEAFEKLCQNSVQDNLTLAYLSSLARLQLSIAEKLNLSFT